MTHATATAKRPRFANPAARLTHAAFAQVDGSSIGIFRLVFGLTITVYAVKAIANGEVRGIYIAPNYHFSYWGFSWIKPWPGVGMYYHFVALALSGFFLACGRACRVSAFATAMLFSFVFLCDRTAYLNHMYLIMLLSWMMVVIPADRFAALDGVGERRNKSTIPAWSLWLVRFHIGVPYFFGGIAKIRADWIQGQPMRMTLSSQPWYESVSHFAGAETVVFVFAIGGLLFDLVIIPALLWQRTRLFAFAACLVFHLTNALVFPIGVFPWLMMGATTIFFAPDWPRRLLATLNDKYRTSVNAEHCTLETSQRGTRFSERALLATLAVYVVMHSALPLRHWVTPGDPNWTERGHFFAWHMMLRGKRCGLRMYVTNRSTGETHPVDLRRYVTAYQYPKVSRDPEHIRQLAKFIAESAGDKAVEVRAFALVSLNGRKAELLVDPAVDLASEQPSWRHPHWIKPLQNPLLKHHWDVPLLEWEQVLEIRGDQLISRAVEASRKQHRSNTNISSKASANRQSEATDWTGVSRG